MNVFCCSFHTEIPIVWKMWPNTPKFISVSGTNWRNSRVIEKWNMAGAHWDTLTLKVETQSELDHINEHWGSKYMLKRFLARYYTYGVNQYKAKKESYLVMNYPTELIFEKSKLYSLSVFKKQFWPSVRNFWPSIFGCILSELHT